MENTTTTEMSGKEDLTRQCAEEILNRYPQFAGFTVDEVLEHEECRKQIDALVAKKAAELDAQAKKDAEKAVADKRRRLNELATTLEAEQPVSQEQIEAKLSQVAKTATPQKPTSEQNTSPQIPDAVIELKKSHGVALLGCVYEEVKKAVLFRSWLISCVKRYREVLAKQGLEKEYGSVLKDISGQIQALITKVADVISAWGLDPKEAWFSDSRMYAQIRDAASADKRFAGFTRVITPEEMKELANAEVADQEQEDAHSAAKNKTREEIVAKFTAAGFSADAAGKLTRKCVKNYFDECNGDAVRMIRKMAINKMAKAESDEDKATARLIAKAAEMPVEELETSVKCQQAIHGIVLQHIPDFGAKQKPDVKTAATDRNDPNYGAEKPDGKKNRGKK